MCAYLLHTYTFFCYKKMVVNNLTLKGVHMWESLSLDRFLHVGWLSQRVYTLVTLTEPV